MPFVSDGACSLHILMWPQGPSAFWGIMQADNGFAFELLMFNSLSVIHLPIWIAYMEE